jgi:transposase-like protein
MYLHANAKLGLAGRLALVRSIEDGLSLKAAAAAFSVSPATAHRWWHRWLEAGEEARRTLECLVDRSSRPHRSPRQLAPQLEQAICACRRQTGWGAEAGRRRHRLLPIDRLEGAQAGRVTTPLEPVVLAATLALIPMLHVCMMV